MCDVRLSAQTRLAVLFVVLALLVFAAGPAIAQDPAPTPTIYVVKRGDTLAAIAQRFGTTVDAIVEANDIRDRSLIVPGQQLLIPAGAQVATPPAGPTRGMPARAGVEEARYRRVHTARAGETLPALAFRYGTTVWALQVANTLKRPWLLLPGQPVVIPPANVILAGRPAFPTISTSPTRVVQGNTLVVQVKPLPGLPQEIRRPSLDLTAKALGLDLTFVEGEKGYWALVGVDALTKPGTYPLTLRATEGDTGDELTMRHVITVTAGDFATYNVPVPVDRQNLLDPELGRVERQKLKRIFSQASPKRLWAGKFGYPLRGEFYTSAPFGQRRSYAGGPVSSYHTGHDYSVDAGTPVYAPITGTVVLAEPLQVRGKAVILDHGLGVYTGFWHLSKIAVEVGQLVGPGKVIGRVGNTGLSTGPHLHWEMRVHGIPVNPLQWTRRSFP